MERNEKQKPQLDLKALEGTLKWGPLCITLKKGNPTIFTGFREVLPGPQAAQLNRRLQSLKDSLKAIADEIEEMERNNLKDTLDE